MNQIMCPIFFAAESPLHCWTIPGTGARQGPGLGCCYFLQLQNFADGFYNFMLCNFDISFHTERKLTWDTIKLNKCSLFVLTSSSSSGTAVYYAGSWWWPHPSLDPGQVPATCSCPAWPGLDTTNTFVVSALIISTSQNCTRNWHETWNIEIESESLENIP